MRRCRLTALLVGIGLLLAAVALGVRGARVDARAEQLRSLDVTATEQAAALNEYFERARTITLLLSHNPVFAEYLAAGQLGTDPTTLRAAVDESLSYLQTLYPDGIGEACFISAGGRELSRSVHGTAAPATDLSDDESGAAFFAPTLMLPRGRVYQARPYLSPDTDTWVIANATPIGFTPAGPAAMVHYEVELSTFLPAPGPGDVAMEVLVVDGQSGRVVLDAAHPQLVPDTREGGPWTGLLGPHPTNPERDGRAITTHAVTGSAAVGAGNANRWFVVASAPEASIHLRDALDTGSVLLLLGGLCVLGVAFASYQVAQRELRVAAERDHLTGLPNRARFQEALTANLRRARRGGDQFALLLMDLVRFKDINDTLGHTEGDRLLIGIAARLQATLRDVDLIARLGGDEFAVLLPGDGSDAEAVAERIVEAFRAPIVLGQHSVTPTFSIGIAVYPDDAQQAEDLLRLSDIAMYDAKRAQVSHRRYSEHSDLHTGRRMSLVTGLRAAVEGHQLTVHYQPQLDLVTDRVVAVEALARWHHNEHGDVAPDEFIPLAEQHGLIDGLTRVILDQALAGCAGWLAADLEVTVSVNISACSLGRDGLVAAVTTILDRHGVAPERLRLELTETAVMADPEGALRTLTELHAMGVRLAVDDFGTGYSSLAYLRHLPVDEIKIDQTFITRLATDHADAHIVRSTIELAHSLGLSVVAEGVEDAATLAVLRDFGCDRAQGYHVARPMPADQVPGRLSAASLQP